jgi:epoxyqueuosine reductase
MSLKNEVKQLAYSEGVQLLAMSSIETYDDYLAEVKNRVKETGAGHEDFMNPSAAKIPDSKDTSFFIYLSDPRNTLPTARTIIVLGVYGYDEAAIYNKTRQELRGKTARVYKYYPVIRQIAERMVGYIEKHGYRATHGQHIPLKYLADRIGLGVYGKNGILQTEQYGSYVALRNVLTDAEFAVDKFDKKSSPCDDCDRCIKGCPTGAIYAPYKVNPKLCLNPVTRTDSYIKPQIRSKMQNWIIGCDICQEVCPVNGNLTPRRVDPRACFDPLHHASHKYLEGLEQTPDLLSLLSARKPDVIRRNAAIALANVGSDNQEVLMALKEQLVNISPGLKEYFEWAINKLTPS